MTRPARAPTRDPGSDLAREVEEWCRLRLAPRRPPLRLPAAAALLRDALRPPDPQPGLTTVRFGRATHLAVAGTETTLCGRELPALIATVPGARITCMTGCSILPPEAD